MKTLPKQTLDNGEEELMSLQGDFLASLSPLQVKEGERMITVTSGRTCSVLYGKSDPLGLLVKTLLESSRWFSPARRLKWESKPLFSEKITEKEYCYDKSMLSKPSVKTLSEKDIPSNRYLFRLVPSERPTEETGCGLLPTGIMLQTPTSVQTLESPEKMRARVARNGYRNGTKYGSLTSQRPSSNSQCPGSGQIHEEVQPEEPDGDCVDCNGYEWDATNSNSEKLQEWLKTGRRSNEAENRARMDNGIERFGSLRYAPYSYNKRLQGCINFGSVGKEKKKSSYEQFSGSLSPDWKNFPTQSPVCRGNDGLPFNVDDLTIPFTKWRQESVKGYGNAIVPQVILEIFKAIEEVEQ